MKAILFLFLFLSISCSSITLEKVKCIISNEKIFKEITAVINSFKNKDFSNIISKVYEAFITIKEEIQYCLNDESEPNLKIGCRFEEQYKNCQKNSCDYMDEYECYEYCYRKYC